jgi:hypothetical protein
MELVLCQIFARVQVLIVLLLENVVLFLKETLWLKPQLLTFKQLMVTYKFIMEQDIKLMSMPL